MSRNKNPEKGEASFIKEITDNLGIQIIKPQRKYYVNFRNGNLFLCKDIYLRVSTNTCVRACFTTYSCSYSCVMNVNVIFLGGKSCAFIVPFF